VNGARLLFVSAIVIAPALASAGGWPCRDDAKKLCPKVSPAGGAVLGCLQQHESELSDACREKMSEMKEHVREARDACGEDAKKLCPDVKAGGGAIARCLSQHESELSDGCKAMMKKRPMSAPEKKGKEEAPTEEPAEDDGGEPS
jgi:hypothetical protein